MMLTRSHSASTSARMWLESSTVRPAWRASSMHSWKTVSLSGSSPEVGSSSSSSSASDASAGDQRDLLPVALGVGAALLGRVELEALDQLLAAGRVEAAAQAAEQVDRLAAGEVGPQVDVAGHVGEPAVELDGVGPRVAAQQADLAGVGAQEAEQDADGGRLAGAVGTEEAVHLARLDGQVEPVERAHVAEGLDEP